MHHFAARTSRVRRGVRASNVSVAVLSVIRALLVLWRSWKERTGEVERFSQNGGIE